jgi:hypothetical protein
MILLGNTLMNVLQYLCFVVVLDQLIPPNGTFTFGSTQKGY